MFFSSWFWIFKKLRAREVRKVFCFKLVYVIIYMFKYSHGFIDLIFSKYIFRKIFATLLLCNKFYDLYLYSNYIFFWMQKNADPPVSGRISPFWSVHPGSWGHDQCADTARRPLRLMRGGGCTRHTGRAWPGFQRSWASTWWPSTNGGRLGGCRERWCRHPRGNQRVRALPTSSRWC